MIPRSLSAFVLLGVLAAGSAAAQEAELSLDAPEQDTGAPVQVDAESLSLDQEAGLATFSGNVVVSQGEMRLSAPEVLVTYASGEDASRRITTVKASGGVTLATGAEAAEAQEAVYTVDEGSVVMTGDVVLTQGESTISGQRLVLDLASGSGRIEGGVRTIFDTGAP